MKIFTLLLFAAMLLATALNPAQAQIAPLLPPTQSPKDLVYVAVQPCRVADTRKSSEGFIKANTFRNFRIGGKLKELAVQGGASACGNPRPGSYPVAVAAYILAIPNGSSTGKGVLSVYPSDQSPPPVGSGSTVNFATGQTIGNTTIATLCTSGCPDGGELAIMSRKSDEHVVIDVQGYFYPPTTSPFSFSTSTEDLELSTTGEGPIEVLSLTIDVPGKPGLIELHANTQLESRRADQQPITAEVACAIKMPTEGDWTEMYPAAPEHRVEPSLARWRYESTRDDHGTWKATLTTRGVRSVILPGTYTYLFVCNASGIGRSRSAIMTAEFIPDS